MKLKVADTEGRETKKPESTKPKANRKENREERGKERIFDGKEDETPKRAEGESTQESRKRTSKNGSWI